MTSFQGRLLPLVVAAGLALLAPPPARADFVLRVFDDGALAGTFVVATGTQLNALGQSSANFAYDVIATSNSPGLPDLANVSNFTISARNTNGPSGSAHTLTFALSDVNFTQPSTPDLILRSTVRATWGVPSGITGPDDRVDFTSYANTDNRLFASTASPLTDPGQVGNAANTVTSAALTLFSVGQGLSNSDNAPDVVFPRGVPYSISSKLVIRLDEGHGVSVTGSSTVFPTPEPGTLALLLAGVPAAFAAYRARRRRATTTG